MATTTRKPGSFDPAEINGDRQLTAEERRAYCEYHAQRNLANAAASRDEHITTRRLPMCHFRDDRASSPSRACVSAFFRMAARALGQEMGRKDVCILDLGCGRGTYANDFEDAGFTGRYIGLDRDRHEGWTDRIDTPLTRELIQADAQSFDAASLPPLDIIISATALEHIRDDLGTLQRLRSRLKPTAGEAHFVPAEGSLHLYGPHGWRQYSPRCMRRLFPEGEIFRMAGPASSWLHYQVITLPIIHDRRTLLEKLPKAMYAVVRTWSLHIDRILATAHPARSPSMYGVLCLPSHRRTSHACTRAA